ncbi:MAG: MBL fold metallo-hydrolase [Deltaproteobacteria bacterium]|nr:MBL fold metallo-hydrolase [Deltaproteobacteria bacterium]
MQASSQWAGDGFDNPQPLWNNIWGTVSGMFDPPPDQSPSTPIPVEWVDPVRFETPPSSGLRVTWLGHSTTLVEIDGVRVLTDPVWGQRTAPVDWIGPQRWFAPPLELEDVPPIDVVVISHDHYDHLDHPTIEAIRDWDTHFITPLGVGAHLEYWGVAPDHITELGWWEDTEVAGLTITATPARHASGRYLLDYNDTLWAGYALATDHHRVYFSGDTGLFPAMMDIGKRLGPFDVTMIEVGAYDQGWPDWHIGPEQAVKAHRWVRGGVMLPIHWGLFDLANHGWTEPLERVIAEAKIRSVRVSSPPPGGSIEPAKVGGPTRWWPTRPWRTAEQYPLVSTKVE